MTQQGCGFEVALMPTPECPTDHRTAGRCERRKATGCYYLILTSYIPNCEADVFVLHSLHIETLKLLHR